jgi:hypothetical protein
VDPTPPLFMAACDAPGMTATDLAAIHCALVEASRRLSASGCPINYLRTTYLPSRQRWIGVFAAAAPDEVHRAVGIAQLPAVDVTEAIEIASPGLCSDFAS